MTRAPNDAVGFSVVARAMLVEGPLDATRPRVARFPGWTHGNRTHNGSTSGACKAISQSWGPHLPRNVTRALCPLRPIRVHRVDHSSGICDLLFRLSLSTSPVHSLPIISALSTDFDRQFDYGCYSHRTRDFDSRLSFARSGSTRNTSVTV